MKNESKVLAFSKSFYQIQD